MQTDSKTKPTGSDGIKKFKPVQVSKPHIVNSSIYCYLPSYCFHLYIWVYLYMYILESPHGFTSNNQPINSVPGLHLRANHQREENNQQSHGSKLKWTSSLWELHSTRDPAWANENIAIGRWCSPVTSNKSINKYTMTLINTKITRQQSLVQLYPMQLHKYTTAITVNDYPVYI